MIAMPWPRQAFAAEPGREAEFTHETWLRIGADNNVTVITPTAEIGQGTKHRALPDRRGRAGRELNDIGFELAPVADVYKKSAFRNAGNWRERRVFWSFMPILRNAAAAARTNLVAAAARQWGVEPGSCIARKR